MSQFRSLIILLCLDRINGERSIYSIYHLLHGKKSSQTIQDAKLFKLAEFFQIMPTVSRSDLKMIINVLHDKAWIIGVREDTYILSSEGKDHLKRTLEIYPIPLFLNGWRYSRDASLFWQRLTLSTQTLSFLVNGHRRFLPIITNENIQHWVRGYIKSIDNHQERSADLFQELHSILDQVDERSALIFVLRLSGYHRVGYTIEQISRQLQMDSDYTSINFQSVLHFILQKIEQHPQRYKELQQFCSRNERIVSLTFSARKTYELLQHGKSMDEIAIIRNLKLSTIEDHIVEIASEIKGFSIRPYVTLFAEENIRITQRKLSTKRLKSIRDALNGSVSYFQIRLVLARGEELCS